MIFIWPTNTLMLLNSLLNIIDVWFEREMPLPLFLYIKSKVTVHFLASYSEDLSSIPLQISAILTRSSFCDFSQSSHYSFGKYWRIEFNKYSKWPPSAWMHIMTRSNLERVNLLRTAVSLTCLLASKIRWSGSPLMSTLSS